MITKEAFEAWLDDAAPGEWIEYHTGVNLCGAYPGLAAAAYEASLDRRVALMMKRGEASGDEKVREFAYLAFRVSAECPAKLFPRRVLEGYNMKPVSERKADAKQPGHAVRQRRTRAEIEAGVPAFRRSCNPTQVNAAAMAADDAGPI